MLTSIREFFSEYNAFVGVGEKIIIAVSGGADSVCLLYALLELKDELGITLEVCHVNHGLRGNASGADEEFVRDLCERLDVPLRIGKIDVKSFQKKHESLEQRARNARYAFLSETALSANSKIIATAHNAGDNAETVLLNLVRGTGLRGLCGIPPVRIHGGGGNNNIVIIRPLLKVSRAEILAYLKEKNAEYITDESNFSDEFTRNYLRNNITPLLEKINPSFVSGISEMCGFLRADEEYLRAKAESALEQSESDGFYAAPKLSNLPAPVLNRIISLILSKNNISPSARRIEAVASILETGGKINIIKDKFAVVKKGFLNIETIHQKYRKSD